MEGRELVCSSVSWRPPLHITLCRLASPQQPRPHPHPPPLNQKGIVPREPSVLFTLGRVHKRLGDPDAALAALNGALDLAPSSAAAAAIKAAIDRLHAADDAEEEGM